ncbi:MAG: cbb3-type cytochrome c oxidase subunit I [Candidatus Methylomirabilales bacterium]
MNDKAPSVALPFRYFVTAIVAFTLAAVLLPFIASDLADFYYQPRLLALTHLITLGWITMTIMGASYQLVPVALGIRLYSERLARIQFWFMLVGTLGMVGHFWIGRWGGLIASALLVLIASSLYLANLGMTLRGLTRWNVTAKSMGAALLFFAATVVLGNLMALDKVLNFLRGDFLGILHGHFHLAALGWVTMMITGVAYHLIPMFTLSELRDEGKAHLQFWLLFVGTMGLVGSLLRGYRFLPLFAGMVVAAILLFADQMRRILKARRRRILDWGIRHFTTALIYLVALTPLGLLFSLGLIPDGAFGSRLAFMYGFLVLIGWVSFTIVGMLYKIIPFLVWYHAYSRQVGRGPVPTLQDLCPPELQRLGYFLFNSGILGMAAGLLIGEAGLIRAFGVILTGAVLLFTFTILLVLRHLRPSW